MKRHQRREDEPHPGHALGYHPERGASTRSRLRGRQHGSWHGRSRLDRGPGPARAVLLEVVHEDDLDRGQDRHREQRTDEPERRLAEEALERLATREKPKGGSSET